MTQQALDRITAALLNSAGADAPVALVAEQVLGKCAAVEQALYPIIGQRGVAALFWRSVHLTRATQAWMPQHSGGSEYAVDLGPLKAALLQQSPAEAARGGAALLSNYHDLLTSLVGRPLTERLLRSVWVAFLAPSSPQDLLP